MKSAKFHDNWITDMLLTEYTFVTTDSEGALKTISRERILGGRVHRDEAIGRMGWTLMPCPKTREIVRQKTSVVQRPSVEMYYFNAPIDEYTTLISVNAVNADRSAYIAYTGLTLMPLSKFTKKELQVAESLGRLLEVKETAKELGISYHTVHSHLKNMRRKSPLLDDSMNKLLVECARVSQNLRHEGKLNLPVSSLSSASS